MRVTRGSWSTELGAVDLVLRISARCCIAPRTWCQFRHQRPRPRPSRRFRNRALGLSLMSTAVGAARAQDGVRGRGGREGRLQPGSDAGPPLVKRFGGLERWRPDGMAAGSASAAGSQPKTARWRRITPAGTTRPGPTTHWATMASGSMRAPTPMTAGPTIVASEPITTRSWSTTGPMKRAEGWI